MASGTGTTSWDREGVGKGKFWKNDRNLCKKNWKYFNFSRMISKISGKSRKTVIFGFRVAVK